LNEENILPSVMDKLSDASLPGSPEVPYLSSATAVLCGPPSETIHNRTRRDQYGRPKNRDWRVEQTFRSAV